MLFPYLFKKNNINSEHLSHPTYRPDIDGIRAIAVLSVVIYHAFPDILRGGFAGVDIFFVISGYLISTIIFNNMERDNFNFIEFYERRIRRIFPSLLLVLLSCGIFGWIALFAGEYRQLGKHIAAGAGFVSNLVLWSESSYFDTIAETKPLLHLWSLGVEEQFYIVWPFFLWAAWKFKFKTSILITVILIASFAINLAFRATDSAADFYAPHSRFWELLSGSTLAYLTIKHSNYLGNFTENLDARIFTFLSRYASIFNWIKIREISSFLGILIFILSFFLINKGKHFPGIWAVLPVLGTFFAIAAGSEARFNKIILSNRLVVWFGLISFPLYLWHWPILSFVRIIEGGSPPRLLRFAAVLGAISLAWLTFRFVERPLRFGGYGKLKAAALFTAMMLIGAIGSGIYMMDGIKGRLGNQSVKQDQPPVHELQLDGYEQNAIAKIIWKDINFNKARDFFLINTPEDYTQNVAILGDSHANRLYQGIEKYDGISAINIGRGTCPPLLDIDVLDQTGTSMECQPLTNHYLNYVRDNKNIKAVVLNAFYPQYNRDVFLMANGKPADLNKAIEDTLNFFEKSGKTVIVALDVPEVSRKCYGVDKKRVIPIWLNNFNAYCSVPREMYIDSTSEIRNIVKRRNNNSVSILNFDDDLCTNDICGEINDNNYIYTSDGNHVNGYGVKIIGSSLHKLLRTVLTNMPLNPKN